MPINHDESQFVTFTVPNEVADMLSTRVARLKESGQKISRSELIRAVLTRTNLDRAERDAVRAKNARRRS